MPTVSKSNNSFYLIEKAKEKSIKKGYQNHSHRTHFFNQISSNPHRAQLEWIKVNKWSLLTWMNLNLTLMIIFQDKKIHSSMKFRIKQRKGATLSWRNLIRFKNDAINDIYSILILHYHYNSSLWIKNEASSFPPLITPNLSPNPNQTAIILYLIHFIIAHSMIIGPMSKQDWRQCNTWNARN